MAQPEPKGNLKRQVYPSTTTTTSTVYNLTNHFSSLKSPKYPPHSLARSLSNSAVLESQGRRVVLESGKEGKKDVKEGKSLEEGVVMEQGKRVFLESGKEGKKVEKEGKKLQEGRVMKHVKRVFLENGKEGKNLQEGGKKEVAVMKQGKGVFWESGKDVKEGGEKEVVLMKQGKRVVLESGKDVKEGKKLEEGGKKEVVNEIGKRRSFNDVKVEIGNFWVTNSAKLVAADMPPLIQIHAVGFARKVKDSLEKFTSKALALSLKKEFDGVYGPAWHCIVGSSFGSFVTHSVGGFLYFSLDQKLYILLFKTTVQRAD